MRLPNPERAVVDLRKLTEYCLDSHHQRGRHKSRAFLLALGITRAEADFLQKSLLAAAKTAECELRGSTGFGERYEIRFELSFGKRRATICSAWFVRRGEDFARLASCYVLS